MNKTIQKKLKQVKDNSNSQVQAEETILDKLKNKQFWLWISPLIFALGVIISVICGLASSVKYFSGLFLLTGSQIIAKMYLKEFYTTDMALLYLSIIGFVIVLIDSMIYAVKNSFLLEKTKLTLFHAIFLLAFVGLSVGTFISKSKYSQTLQELTKQSPISAQCIVRSYSFECILSGFFVEYNKSLQQFVIAFCILFLAFTILFHVNSRWQFQKILEQNKKMKKNESPTKNTVLISQWQQK